MRLAPPKAEKQVLLRVRFAKLTGTLLEVSALI